MNPNQQIALVVLIACGVVGLLTILGGYVAIASAWSDFLITHPNGDNSGARQSGWDLIRCALARKCPVCRAGDLFETYLKMNARCPLCGTAFWKNDGEWMGPAVLDYALAVAAALSAWAISLFLNRSEAFQISAAILAAIASALLIGPWSRSFWTIFLYVTGEITPPSGFAPPSKEPQ